LDKKQLSEKLPSVKKYVQQIKINKKYDACLNETATRKITEKGKYILKNALTPELIGALDSELKFLGVKHLRINLKPTGRSGETRHQMELVNCQPSLKAKLSEILSEGEQHVLAIAGFLAELNISNTIAPIVFDDPVCSLDHLYRAKIAHRLVKEASSRQVIVFTHDISFLLDLETKCGELQGTYFFPQTLRRIGNEPGKCMNGLPWHAMPVKDRTAFISEQIKDARRIFNSDRAAYNDIAGYLYGLLRETWESVIEDTLFQGTVRRHGSEVQTLKLSYVTVTDGDYRTIHLEMAKCSKWMFGHDKSESIDANRPSPDELQSDVETLKEFASQINKRREGIRKQRLQTLKAPKPEAG